MCVSKETSIRTFFIGLLSGIILYKKGQGFYGLFLSAVSLVQLGEYFMWSDLTCEKGLNRIGNIIVVVSAALQLFLHAKDTPRQWVVPLLFVASVLLTNPSFCATETSQGHLRWGFSYMIPLALYLGEMLMHSPNTSPTARNIFYGMFLMSLITIPFPGWPSWWCYISNSVGPLFLLLNPE
jgi:hypothetical protein